MRAKFILILSIILLCGLFALWDLSATPKNTPFNKLAPDFTFTTFDGKQHDLKTGKGKIILVNIWASWCPPCLAEFPDLIKLAQSDPDNIILIGLSVDEDIEAAQTFLKKFNLENQKNILMASDKDKTISRDLFGTTKYPETYIIDKDLKIARHIRGVIDWNSEEMKNYLKILN